MTGFWRRFVRHRAATGGLVVIVLVVLLALTAPILFPGNPFAITDKPFLPPFGTHLLGTDSLGRDVAHAIAHGARTSLLIGLMATLVAVAVGTVLGGFAGYFGGFIDDVLMRLTEFFQTIPYFVFAIVLVAILSPSKESIVIAI